jgi:hypothetical protein
MMFSLGLISDAVNNTDWDSWVMDPPAKHVNNGQMSIGSVLLIVSAVGAVSYCAIGAVLMHRRGNRGKELVPQREMWVHISDLISTGFSFSFSKLKESKLASHLPMHTRYEQL